MKKNLLILFASLFASFTLVEFALGVNGKYLSYNERSSGHAYISPFDAGDDGWIFTYKPFTYVEDVKSEYTFFWTTNNEGLRDKSITLGKTGKRLMAFGDSFTEGAGAPGDSCYPRILEVMLRANFDSTVQVVNCRVSSSDAFFAYQLLKLRMLQYDPDYILLAINSSDFYDFIIRGGFERFIAGNSLRYRNAPWFEPLYAHSYLARHIAHDVFNYGYDFLKPDERAIMLDSANRMIASAIDSFQNLCNSRGIKFGIIFHPLRYEAMQPENYEMGKLIAHCKTKNIPYVDELSFLNSAVKDKERLQNLYWKLDGHLNSDGYELLAQCAFKLIEKVGWLISESPE